MRITVLIIDDSILGFTLHSSSDDMPFSMIFWGKNKGAGLKVTCYQDRFLQANVLWFFHSMIGHSLMLERLVLPPGFNQGVMKTEPRLGGALIIRITDFITRT